MGDEGTLPAEKVDLGKGSHEEQQGGPDPAKEKEGGAEETPPIPPRPGR